MASSDTRECDVIDQIASNLATPGCRYQLQCLWCHSCSFGTVDMSSSLPCISHTYKEATHLWTNNWSNNLLHVINTRYVSNKYDTLRYIPLRYLLPTTLLRQSHWPVTRSHCRFPLRTPTRLHWHSSQPMIASNPYVLATHKSHRSPCTSGGQMHSPGGHNNSVH